MSNFSFDEENRYNSTSNQTSEQSVLIKLVIKLSGGSIKDTQ